jgi:S-adenosylmethionine:tRNA ribosyltransferase-isomerase
MGSNGETGEEPGKRLRVGVKIRFGEKGEFRATVKERSGRTFVLRFNRKGRALSEAIHEHGVMPTPPYITEDLRKPDSYQTVYAEKEGSVAAPTAGLHFTPELMKKLKEKGIKFEFVDLHVGLGTFLPVKTDKIEEHEMHSEYFELHKDVAKRLNKYRKEGRRIIAVGTTSVRVLESCSSAEGKLKASSGETDIFIYPGYEFKFVDALITNFHLPKSTLMMLVSAFANREFMMKAYEDAVKNEYRFYSFGDAMFIE